MTFLPHRVLLKPGWSETLPWSELTRWCVTHKLQSPGDWDYYTAGAIVGDLVHAAIGFRDEGDAIAFRLRFGL